MLITQNTIPQRISSIRLPEGAQARKEAPGTSPTESFTASDRTQPLTYVPTGFGTAALGATFVGSSLGAGALLNALTGNSGLAVGGGMLAGLATTLFVTDRMDRAAVKSYAETGQGTAWLKPAFTPEEISGLPRMSRGVRGLS